MVGVEGEVNPVRLLDDPLIAPAEAGDDLLRLRIEAGHSRVQGFVVVEEADHRALVAGRPSSGKRCVKESMTGVSCHTVSSSKASQRMGLSVRTASAVGTEAGAAAGMTAVVERAIRRAKIMAGLQVEGE